jgi:hypothetical protein
MSLLNDLVEGVAQSVASEIKRKLVGKRRRRRLSPSQRIAKEIERMIKPAKRQVSRKRTVRSRSKHRQRSY